MNQCIGFNSIIRNNSATITYAYDQIDSNGVITKGNIQESFILLPTDTALINANNIILDAINLRLNPPIVILSGSTIVKYVDESNNDIVTPEAFTNLAAGTYYHYAKTFEGYTLNAGSINTQSVSISADNLNPIITFNYTKIVVTP